MMSSRMSLSCTTTTSTITAPLEVQQLENDKSASTIPVPTEDRLGKFDKFAFANYVKNVGGAYRRQSTELISICRTFTQAQEQSPDSDVRLRLALQLVDNAIYSAADLTSKTRTSKRVDEKFERAIEFLSRYEAKYHPRKPVSGASDSHIMTVHERMANTKKKDKFLVTILNALKEKLPLKTTEDEPITVEFFLMKSLPDNNPIIVKQALGRTATLSEILWNFSRIKDGRRLTLNQNPHFYKPSDLPLSRGAYVGEFKTDPIHQFQYQRICVLTDKPGRVFLHTDPSTPQTNPNTRAFGNVWIPDKAIILQDICGKLEGESIVHASIPCTPNSWYLEELRLSQTSLPAIFPSPSAITTASLITSGLGGPFEDWREPIRKGLISLDSETCFRIRGSSHGNACPPTEEHTGTTLAHVQPRLSCFQPVSFEMYPKNKNSAYSNQSMALISIFQGFVRVREPTPSSEARLRLAFQATDVALRAAASANETSTEVDKKFERAVDILSSYEMVYHPRTPVSKSSNNRVQTVRERMATAKSKDRAERT